MGAPENLLTNYDKVAYTSYFDMDKIIGILSGSISVAAPTAGQVVLTGTTTHDTGFGETCYFQGIFSVDGGTTWNDFAAMTPNLSVPGMPVFQTQNCDCYMVGGVITVSADNYYNFVSASSAAKTFLYKIALFAKNAQGTIQPLTIDETTFFDSRYNYHKIFVQDSISFNSSSGVTKSVTIPHSLGYVPRVRAFFQQTGSPFKLLPVSFYFIEPRVTSTSLTFYLDGWYATTVNGTIEYRIYLDA